MLMKGDLQRIINQINPILEGLNARIKELEAKVEAKMEELAAERGKVPKKTTTKAK